MKTAPPLPIEDVSVVPDPDADDRFYYWPGSPGPQRDAMGRSVLRLMAGGSGGTLQAGVRWDVPAETLEALREHLAAQRPDLEPVHVRLAPVPLSVHAVRLVLAGDDGSETVLGESSSSGTPPYSATFQVALNEAQKTRVVEALHGEAGLLLIRYEAAVYPPVAVAAVIEGDASPLLDVLPEEADESEALERVTEAVSAGVLGERVEGEVPAMLQTQAREKARAVAAQLLLAVARGERPANSLTNLSARVRLSDADAVPLHAVTDLSTWLSEETLDAHVHVVPGGSSPIGTDAETKDAGARKGSPSPAAGVVRLGFDARESPLRRVSVRPTTKSGAAGVDLTPASPEALLKAVPPGERLHLTVEYKGFGADYETTRDAAEAPGTPLVLEPADVGLARVTIDASALAGRSVRQARVRVRYDPDARGDRDDHTLHFRRDEWTANWFVVTRAPGLSGTLSVDAVVTAADGGVQRERFETQDPAITL